MLLDTPESAPARKCGGFFLPESGSIPYRINATWAAAARERLRWYAGIPDR
jgi:hypothetical protein